MAEGLNNIFHQGLSEGKDIYIVEGIKNKTPLFHVVLEPGETPDEADVAERSALWSEYDPSEPRLMSYEELAERERIREEAWVQAEAH